jgi:hypothetical protein
MDKELKEKERFAIVHQKVRELLPGALESLVNTSIETGLRFYKRTCFKKVDRMGGCRAPPSLLPCSRTDKHRDFSCTKFVTCPPAVSTRILQLTRLRSISEITNLLQSL